MIRVFSTIGCSKLVAFLLGFAALLSSFAGFAHETLPAIVSELTEKIAQHGNDPSLYISRAYEYRAIGNLPAAHRDLERAVHLQPRSSEARRELGRVLLLQGSPDLALREVNAAVDAAGSDLERALALEVAADVHEACSDWDKALRASEAVLEIRPAYLDELLRRSRLQKRLGLEDSRLTDLERASDRNPSIVLEIELIDALRESGRYVDCLRLIERNIDAVRWRSSWLVRRARVWQAMGKDELAGTDLRAAIEEITPRLRYGAPDLTLLAERATALALLGDNDAAAADLRLARHLGADAWLLEDVERLLDASLQASD